RSTSMGRSPAVGDEGAPRTSMMIPPGRSVSLLRLPISPLRLCATALRRRQAILESLRSDVNFSRSFREQTRNSFKKAPENRHLERGKKCLASKQTLLYNSWASPATGVLSRLEGHPPTPNEPAPRVCLAS